MAGLDREQLEALRRQIEEDYRLDMAAVERLLRRCVPANTSHAPASAGSVSEIRGSAPQSVESLPEPQPDELTNTLRGMFSGYRK